MEELTRINEVMATDMVEPTIGVPFEAALSGFDAAWREESQNDKLAALSRSLFPDPPRKCAQHGGCAEQKCLFVKKRTGLET